MQVDFFLIKGVLYYYSEEINEIKMFFSASGLVHEYLYDRKFSPRKNSQPHSGV